MGETGHKLFVCLLGLLLLNELCLAVAGNFIDIKTNLPGLILDFGKCPTI